MSVLARSIRETWQISRDEIAARWGRFLVLTLLILIGYAGFIFSMTMLNIGALPNYFRWYRFLEGISETLTLSMRLGDRYELLAEQPIFEFGYRQPPGETLTVEDYKGVMTVTLHVIGNLFLMSMLIAAYCLLMSRYLRVGRMSPRSVAGSVVGGGSGSLGILTAGAASVACCGGSGASVVLSLLGISSSVGLFLVEYDRAFGALGIFLMVSNLWFMAKLVMSRECVIRPGSIR